MGSVLVNAGSKTRYAGPRKLPSQCSVRERCGHGVGGGV